MTSAATTRVRVDVEGMTSVQAAYVLNLIWKRLDQSGRQTGFTFWIPRPKRLSAALLNATAAAMGLLTAPRWT